MNSLNYTKTTTTIKTTTKTATMTTTATTTEEWIFVYRKQKQIALTRLLLWIHAAVVVVVIVVASGGGWPVVVRLRRFVVVRLLSEAKPLSRPPEMGDLEIGMDDYLSNHRTAGAHHNHLASCGAEHDLHQRQGFVYNWGGTFPKQVVTSKIINGYPDIIILYQMWCCALESARSFSLCNTFCNAMFTFPSLLWFLIVDSFKESSEVWRNASQVEWIKKRLLSYIWIQFNK